MGVRGFLNMRADSGQTQRDRHTETLITILSTHTGGKQETKHGFVQCSARKQNEPILTTADSRQISLERPAITIISSTTKISADF